MRLKKLTPEDYPRLKTYFRNQKYPLCAYSLSSIIAWSTDYFFPVGAVVDDAVVVGVEFKKNENRGHLILPVAVETDYTPEMLRKLLENTGFKQYFFVPQCYMDYHGRDCVESIFRISEQTAFEDYVYLARDLALLEGNRYSKKRNLINQFKRDYVLRKRVRIEPIHPGSADDCIVFLERWCEERNCDRNDDEELYCEKKAAINTIRNIELLEVDGLLLRIDGAVSAFGMASRLTSDMGVFHFEKAFSQFKGLYQYFDNQCARRMFQSCKYINKESDMDLPGLAKAKKSYYPHMMVKSYKLAIR